MNQEKPTCASYYCNRKFKRKPLKSSKDGYCIFHAGAEEKSVREFEEALRQYMSEIKERNLGYNFSNFVFVGDINFEKDFRVTTFKDAYFWNTIFQGDVDFGKARFQGNATFMQASFHGNADFSEARFQRDAYFGEVIFCGNVSFRGTRFQEDAHFIEAELRGESLFMEARFQRDAYFGKVKFRGDADLGGAKFQGFADFVETEFQEDVYFGRAEFLGHTSFRDANFQEDADFRGAEFRSRASISPKFMNRDVLFGNAILENISLTPLNLSKRAWIDFTGARLRNTQIERKDIEGHVIQEQMKYFCAAKDIYLVLKNNFHSLGRYDDESWAFRKEKEMERKSFWHFRREYKESELGKKWSNKGIKDCFYPALLNFEYAAKYVQEHYFSTPWKEIKRLLSSRANLAKHPIAIIKGEVENFVSFVASNKQEKVGNVSRKELFKVLWLYTKYPIKYFSSTVLKYLYQWGEQPWFIFLWCLVAIFIFSGLYLGGDVIAKDGTLVESYLDKLYFSGVTFTTLGYGDFSPIGGTKFLAFLESFLGVFFIALFVFSFARRTGGR